MGIMESRFRIDQSGGVDHYILGSLRPVWAPWNTWDSSCTQPLPRHCYCYCSAFLPAPAPASGGSALWRKRGMTPLKTLRCRTSSLLPTRNPYSYCYYTLLPLLDPPLLSSHSSSLCNKFHPSVYISKVYNQYIIHSLPKVYTSVLNFKSSSFIETQTIKKEAPNRWEGSNKSRKSQHVYI